LINTGLTRRKILVGEDDAEVRDYLEVALRSQGYEVQLAVDGEEVVNQLRAGYPASLILLDIMMPNKDGWEALSEIRGMNIDVPVIILSGMSAPLNVVQAIKNGATDFLAKPFSHEDLGRVIDHALSSRDDRLPPPEDPSHGLGKGMFFGKNPEMAALAASIPKVAGSDVPVLIQGETGTGKEVLARQVHALSPRAAKPFLKLNCAAVPSELLESELFGYERGAFTGAFQRKLGLFELADGGTILLDEIGDMDVRLQAKLLQVLQDHEFRRLGGTDFVRVNVRVIAATHRDLVHAIREREFREDLYYRLNIFTLVLPPLRARKQDIVGLAQLLIDRHSPPETSPLSLTPALQAAFVAYPWPGNVRQLENVVRKFIVLRDPDAIIAELKSLNAEQTGEKKAGGPEQETKLPPKEAADENSSVLREVSRAKQEAEAEVILKALQRTRWNRKQAAALLKIDYKALLYKMKKLSIEDRANEVRPPDKP
jgi:two-component system response regulator AtoC